MRQPIFDDPRLKEIHEKVEAGTRLSFADGLALFRTPDLLGVGYMANLVRERLHGNVTYFNVNRHINPTDVCVASCRLCAFGKKVRDPKAYTMSLEEVWERAREGYTEAITEFHIVGGLHPTLTLDWYCQMLRGLKQRFPRGASEGLHHGRDRLPRQAHRHLGAGDAGAAEGRRTRFDAGRRRGDLQRAVRRIICDHKIDGNEWLEVAREAHRLGIKSNCTMLYGHIENEEDRVDHLVRLRELQDETGGFVTFIPLAFHPDNTPLQHIPKTTGFTDLKNIAVARLMLDNIPHIKAYWVMMTPRIAQIAQRFGADDIDGTVVEEKIYHDAGATTSPVTAPRRPARADPRGRP